VVDHLIEGITNSSGLLLDPLVERMAHLAAEQRYEEAGWARDRHDALARTIQRSRAWAALGRLGFCEIESEDGARVVLDHGRLVSTWSPGSTPPLRPVPDLGANHGFDVPGSVEAAEEADVIWKWLMGTRITLVDATGTLSLPSRPVDRLARITPRPKSQT
jgi:DNA polymerase-3 subunit epsilon